MPEVLTYIGHDFFDRSVFTNEAGAFFKSYEEKPTPFDLFVTDAFDGEPSHRVSRDFNCEFAYKVIY